ncbi:hypothetical protein V8E52_008649 [Russula decolorans]
MPRKKHTIKLRNKNVEAARKAREEKSQIYFENKDNLIISDNGPLQHAVEECEGGQAEEEIAVKEPYNGLEIVEQSALDHFSAILQKAQRAAAEASRDQKRPRTYDGKSKRTLKRRRKFQDDLAKKGYLSHQENYHLTYSYLLGLLILLSCSR